MNTDLGKKSALGIGLGLVALVCAGCSAGSGTVSGTVTYKNKPLPTGSITFVTPNGRGEATIENGKYTAEKVPTGDAKISLFVPSPPNMKFFGAPKDAGGTGQKDLPPEAQKMLKGAKGGGPTVNIPVKYTDTETSGLTVTVKAGQNPPFNIELKD